MLGPGAYMAGLRSDNVSETVMTETLLGLLWDLVNGDISVDFELDLTTTLLQM